uniref:Uncharacterized protein n=1 Tax=Arundo donax TaxID=35708 RepID=A0A0A9BKL7_ARUDO
MVSFASEALTTARESCHWQIAARCPAINLQDRWTASDFHA